MWKNNKIKSIKWNDFFNIESNKMVVYRITPHTNVTNNTNRKLWKMLHKMYSVYDKAKDRRTWKFKGGFKITQREKDFIWYDIVFRQVNGEKKVEFYFSTSEIWSKKFKETIENKLSVTIDKVGIEELEVPNDAIVHELKYMRHDMFSMNTDAREQTTPISGVLSALDDIEHDGDYARLSFCNETFDRNKWAKHTEWAYEKLKKDKVPQRVSITSKKAFNLVLMGLSVIVNEVNGFIHDTLNAISNVFFKSEKTIEHENIEVKKNTLESELGKHNLSKQTHDKRNLPVWKSRIRVATKTTNKLRSDLLSNTISSALSEIGDDNELHPVKVRFGKRKKTIEEMNTLQLSPTTKSESDVNLISCDELGKLHQLPTAELQRQYENEMVINRKVETDIPSIFIHKRTDEHVKVDNIKISVGSNNITANGNQLKVNKPKENGLFIGHSTHKGKVSPIGIPTTNKDELYRSVCFMGGMGMGKDCGIQNFVTEGSLNHNMSFVVLDQVCEEGERGMANGIRNSLPPEKIIDIDLSNEDYLPPLDLSEVMHKLGRKGADRFANELIYFMEVDDMGQSRSILRNFAKASNGSLYQLKELLENEAYREERVEELRSKGNGRLANELAKYLSEYEEVVKKDKQGNITSREWKCVKDGQKALNGKSSAILNRLDEFLGDDTLYNIFAQPPKNDLNFEQWIKEGKVIIFRIPENILSTVAVKTLIHWITLKVLMTRQLMKKESQENGCFMVYNELHTYMTKGLEDLLVRVATQGRKHRLGALFAIQQFNLLPPKLQENLTGGGVNWLLFRSSNENIYEKLEKLGKLAPAFDMQSAMSIDKWHAIGIFEFGGKPQPSFLIDMLEPPYKRYRPYDNSFLTKRHARMYGRSYEEIDELLGA